MRHAALAVFGAAATGFGFAGPGLAQEIIGSEFHVRNTLPEPLSCRIRPPGGAWSDSFTITSRGEFSQFAAEDDRIEITCGPPAAKKAYKLKPGKRYLYLKERGKPVELRRMMD